jgi:hypothetical protein
MATGLGSGLLYLPSSLGTLGIIPLDGYGYRTVVALNSFLSYTHTAELDPCHSLASRMVRYFVPGLLRVHGIQPG